MKLYTKMETTPHYLARMIIDSCDFEEIKELIKELDELVCDYEFTKELRDYFDDIIKHEDEDDKEDVNYKELEEKLEFVKMVVNEVLTEINKGIK